MKHPNFLRSRRTSSHEKGSVLISAALASAVLAILIGGFLTYISNEYTLNKRAHMWNQSLNMAEGGVELAFAEFNYYYAAGSNAFASSRGWYSMGGGSYSNVVSNFSGNDGKNLGTIYSYVNGVGTANPSVSGYAQCSGQARGPAIWRRVNVVLSGTPLFPCAIAAKSSITLSGSAVFDSFNSSDPSMSTGGQYDWTKRQANCNVGTDSTATKAISMSGGAAIYGNANTGPGGTVDMSGGATLGSTLNTSLRVTTPAAGITAGYIQNTFSTAIPDVTLPSTLSSAPSLGTVNLSGTTLAITAGNWQATGVSLSGSSTITISGNVTLYCSGQFSVSGSSVIKILTGSSLTVYAGNTVNVSGGGVVNAPGLAANNLWYGLPGCTAFSYSGSSAWVGAAYVPQAAVNMSGGAAQSGALVGNTINFSGGSGFHYDQALASLSGNSGYTLASWKSYRYDATSGSWNSD